MQKDWVIRGKKVLDIEIAGLRHVQKNLGTSFNSAITTLAACTGRVVVTGIGKSGLIGRKLAATLSSTGTPSFFMHPVEGAHGDLGSIRAKDVIIAISYSGKNAELNALLPTLRTMGSPIIALTSGLTSPLARLADIVIDCAVPKEACSMNLVPTASTTATLAIGDALAVCLIDQKVFTVNDFKKFHPGGALGQRLKLAVADIMHTTDIPLLVGSHTMKTALAAVDKGALGAVIFTNEDGCLQGILTDGDIRRALCQGSYDPNADAQNIMTKNPRFASPEQSVAELMDLMEKTSITVVPVLGISSNVVGVVHMHDLLGKGEISFA